MRTGFENKRNVIILSVLGVGMIGAVVYFASSMFGGSPTPAPANSAQNGGAGPETAQLQTAARDASGRPAQKMKPLEKLDPTLHPELMAGAEALEYSGKGRNIFSMTSVQVELPKPTGPVRVAMNTPPPPPPGPPPPPPIDLKFFGYSADAGAKKAFLLRGDDVFIANEGDVVDHHYKVVKISPLSIQVTDLLYNNTQTLPLSQS
jgi:hypothetical protein